MNTPRAGPSEAEARELLRLARMGAAAAGASGSALDDVSQSVVEKLTEKWDEPHVVAARGRGESGWQAYIFVAARNAFRDLGRADGRRRAREIRARSADRQGDQRTKRPGTHRQGDYQPSEIDEYLGRRLVIDIIDECLQGDQHEIALLTFVGGLSTKEIAELLGLAIRAVNQHKKQATDMIRSFLRPDPTD